MSTLRAIVGAFRNTRAPWERSPSALAFPPRFDSAARMASFVAHEQAREHGENGVCADHLLLALLEQAEITQALTHVGANLEEIRALVLARLKPDARDYSRDGVMPRTSVLQLVWRCAHEIADERASIHITPQILLAAVAAASRTVNDRMLLAALKSS